MLTVCTVVSITAKPSPPAAHPLPYRRVQLLGLGDEQLVQCVATDEAVLEQVMVSSLCLRLPNTAHPLKQRYQQVDRYPRTITATNRVSESPSQQLKQVDVEWPAQWGMFGCPKYRGHATHTSAPGLAAARREQARRRCRWVWFAFRDCGRAEGDGVRRSSAPRRALTPNSQVSRRVHQLCRRQGLVHCLQPLLLLLPCCVRLHVECLVVVPPTTLRQANQLAGSRARQLSSQPPPRTLTDAGIFGSSGPSGSKPSARRLFHCRTVWTGK